MRLAVIRVILAAIHLAIPAFSIGLYGLLQMRSFKLASGLDKAAQDLVLQKWFSYELAALFVVPPLASWLVLWAAEVLSHVKEQGELRWYRFRKLLIGLGTWLPFVITFLMWAVAYSIDMLLAMISIVMIVPAHLGYAFLVWLALPEYAERRRE